MRARIENHHERAIGTQGGMLPPGESIEVELTEAEFEAWQGVEYAEVSNVDRSEGSSHQATTAKDRHKGPRK